MKITSVENMTVTVPVKDYADLIEQASRVKGLIEALESAENACRRYREECCKRQTFEEKSKKERGEFLRNWRDSVRVLKDIQGVLWSISYPDKNDTRKDIVCYACAKWTEFQQRCQKSAAFVDNDRNRLLFAAADKEDADGCEVLNEN